MRANQRFAIAFRIRATRSMTCLPRRLRDRARTRPVQADLALPPSLRQHVCACVASTRLRFSLWACSRTQKARLSTCSSPLVPEQLICMSLYLWTVASVQLILVALASTRAGAPLSPLVIEPTPHPHRAPRARPAPPPAGRAARGPPPYLATPPQQRTCLKRHASACGKTGSRPCRRGRSGSSSRPAPKKPQPRALRAPHKRLTRFVRVC